MLSQLVRSNGIRVFVLFFAAAAGAFSARAESPAISAELVDDTVRPGDPKAVEPEPWGASRLPADRSVFQPVPMPDPKPVRSAIP